MDGHERRYPIEIWLLAGAVAVAGLVVVVIVVVRFYATGAAALPNAAAYGRSAPVRQADAAAAAWQDRQFGALQGQQRWLVPAGRSVADDCMGSGGGSGPFGGETLSNVSCQRTDTRYYAFAGACATRRSELD